MHHVGHTDWPLTNNHNVEVETLAHTLAVPLVGEVGKSNVTSQLAAHDVLSLRGSRDRRRNQIRIGARNSLYGLKELILVARGGRCHSGRSVGSYKNESS
jgi:hypothetical protein